MPRALHVRVGSIATDASGPQAAQVLTPFGSGYVPEGRADETYLDLAPSDVAEVVASLRASMFDEVMKALRSALLVR